MENCVVCCEQDWDDCFEIQEFVSKDTYVFKVSYLKTILVLLSEPKCKLLSSHFTVDELEKKKNENENSLLATLKFICFSLFI